MVTKYKLLLIAIFMVVAQNIYSQHVPITLNNVIVGASPQQVVKNDRMGLEFNVVAQNDGSYYACFWVHPIRFASNEYSAYSVYVNDIEVGAIQPDTPGWQAIGLSDNSVVSLVEGNNKILVLSDECTTPMVERVQFASNYASAQITNEANQNLLQNDLLYTANDAMNDFPVDFVALPVKYTYNQQILVNPNEEIEVLSYDNASHAIDVFFIGMPGSNGVNDAIRQHLSYYKGSENYSLVGTQHKTHLRFKSRTPGLTYYRIKLRGGESGIQQVVDSIRINIIDTAGNVRKTYFADDCKAFFAHADGVLTAGESYVSRVRNLSPGACCPSLNITGCGSTPGRVINHAVIVSISESEYELTTSPLVSTSGFHVYDSNSLSDLSGRSCYVQLISSGNNGPNILQAKGREYTSVSDISSASSDLNINQLKESVVVSGGKGHVIAKLYNKDGVCIVEVSGLGETTISTSELSAGFYMVVATDALGQVHTQKIVVR